MINLLYILSILPLVVSCGMEMPTYIHPDLLPYYNEYVKECNDNALCRKATRMDIGILTFRDTLPTSGQKNTMAIGVCYYQDREVYIRSDIKDKLNEYTYKALVWHELGHCMHNLQHNEKTTIMSSNSRMIYSNKSWQQAKKEFYNEFK